MYNEGARRLRLLGAPEAAIKKFLSEGLPYCTGEHGEEIPLTEDDLEHIKQIKKFGSTVYFVNHRFVYGAEMHSYVVVSSEKEDYEYEFSQATTNLYDVFAFVTSALTYDTFDGGTITLYCNKGSIYRVDVDEAAALFK